jgi:hypothetical protein
MYSVYFAHKGILDEALEQSKAKTKALEQAIERTSTSISD